MANNEKQTEAIYDVRQLGTGKTLILGLQHLFAMFGATVLVPAITGLNVSTTLLFAGLGTLLFHLITGRKVPAFLGSSFAFLGGYAAIAPMLEDASGNATIANTQMLPYACFGVAVAGLVYLVLAGLFKIFGAWHPIKIALASLLFGFCRALGNVYSGFDFLMALHMPGVVYNMLPYLISLIVLAFTSGNSRAPKAAGIPYDKGSR